jgi:arylformamidase
MLVSLDVNPPARLASAPDVPENNAFMPPRIHDISLPVIAGGLIYPGNPPIEIASVSAMSAGASSNGSRLSFGSHTATHVDAQHHMIDGGWTVDQMRLDVLIGPALLVRFPDDVMSVTAAHLTALDLSGVERILFATRNSGFNRETEFRRDYTFVAPDAAELLVSKGIRLVGVDYLSIEQFRSGHHRTHKTLLGADVIIIEGLALADVPPGRYELICLPLSLPGLDGAPARAVLRELTLTN